MFRVFLGGVSIVSRVFLGGVSIVSRVFVGRFRSVAFVAASSLGGAGGSSTLKVNEFRMKIDLE